MKLIILGAKGMMGSMMAFVCNSKSVPYVALGRTEFDALISSIDSLEQWCNEPCCIVNCIGAIPQKIYSADEMKYLNQEFPHRLSEFCKDRDISLIHLSTNCVFSGNKSMCNESDIPDADDLYGQSKRLGEPTYGLVIRSSIIGLESQSAFGLLEWFLHSTSESIQGYTDHFWNGLTTLELSNFIVTKILEDSIPEYGCIHLHSDTTVSKYELLTYSKSLFNKSIDILPVEKGCKYYTLVSNTHNARSSIFQQLQ